MLRRKCHIAVVVNNTEVRLVCNFEDCIEEIVGEIYDENDAEQENTDREDEFEETGDGQNFARFVNEVAQEGSRKRRG